MTKIGRLGAALLVLGAPATSAMGQAGYEHRVDSLMTTVTSASTPGAGVLVVQDGHIALEKGYGLAVVATNMPIRSDTRFLLASVSKQFTAMAIMILAEHGKLSYDDRLSTFFPEFPRYADSITVRQLLNHVAGFPEYEGLFMDLGKVGRDWPRSATTPRAAYEPTAHDALELLAEHARPHFRAGDRFEYSNSGYMILAQIVEKVSGQRYARFLDETIFRPLGMNETAVYDETKPAIPNRASSYRPKSGGYEEIDYTPFNFIYGEDNVVTTLNDLYKWDQALYGETLVHRASLEQAFKPAKLSDGSESQYGFGWNLQPMFGVPVVGHTGSWMGFRTAILRIPDKRTTVVVLSNAADFRAPLVAQSIARIYLEGRVPDRNR